MSQNKQLNMLGLALRAGQLIHGDEQVEAGVKNNQARVVVLASDASEATIQRYQELCQRYNIPLNLTYERYQISHAVGKARSVVAVTNQGMAKKFLSYEQESEDSYDA